MASISLPPQSRSGFPQHFDSSAPSDINSSHRMSMPAPLPNPPFVFPARNPDAADSQSEMSESRTPPALPAFSFNPGSSQPLQPTPAHNSRAGGHRRRPSEFVGGDQLVTPPAGDGDKREEPSSPTKPSAPSGPPPGRGPGRRNHAHRRSAAVSGVDLNVINKALGTNLTAGSAPCTPGDRHFDTGHEDISRPLSYSAGSLGRPTPPASPQFAPVPPVPPVPPIPAAIYVQPAPSNDDEEIGRPVSAVSGTSNETWENNTTVRFEQPENPPPVQLRSTQNMSSKPRPKTADASLAFDLIQSQNTPDVPAVKRSKSTGHSRFRKSMSTGNLEAMLANNGTDDAHLTDTSRPSYSDDGSESCDSEHDGDGTCPKKSRSKSKKKRVRSWAGAILTRGKGKRHLKTEPEEKKRPPALTSPTLTRTNSEVGSVLDVDFDNDDVVVLRTPTSPDGTFAAAESAREEPPTPASAPAPSLETSWKPRSFYEQTAQDDMLSSPIIDLDAALGPFNTPDMRPMNGAPSKFSVATQRMYSGGRRGEFVGPEMRYHRRTESAPVMQPFDRSSLGPIRLGGNTTETPDVFYEEEEDAFLAASQSPRGRATPVPSGRATPAQSGRVTPVEIIVRAPALLEDKLSVKSDASADTVGTAGTARTAKTADTLIRAPEASSPMSSPEQAGLGIRASDEVSSQPEVHPVDRHLADPMHGTSNPFAGQSRSPIEILKSQERIPRPRVPPSPDVSPGFLAIDKRPATSPNELPPSIPAFSLSAGVSPSDSSFPSPDVSRSFNDRTFSSHSYHHLPSEYPYASVEDVPSLTSSASTMTNPMNRFSSSFFPRARLSTDRAASFSAAVNRRTSQANASKRSSLASLSKLVGGPHSERSKLHQEEKPPGDEPDHSKKKGRRLSRLMHFWKVRDKENSGTEAASSDRPM
ncbi:uncharacterized protein N7498_005482 [Penicillium cinerascens]|uniref:Cell wall proline rich protein n=1 Tax=Penicillium cinerascens TaxID=70096 RepID=A0A9W9T066_9EURO|nr:uncharacterized protein N7498_005482 [Penicillium cinerascens]KAJ5204603.1 hypothetical protein N7498_005482 [Penicillium cinerascens]